MLPYLRLGDNIARWTVREVLQGNKEKEVSVQSDKGVLSATIIYRYGWANLGSTAET